MKPGTPRQRAAGCFALALGATLLAFAALYLLLGRPDHGIDDADITAVYARNIAHGAGIVYTPGGERVEGSTSLAWTLLSALLVAAGAETGHALFAASVLLCALAVFAALCVADRVIEDPRARWLTLAILATSPAFFVWSLVSLLDTPLWCAALGVALLLALAPRARATALALPLALAFLMSVRPEAILIAPALALLHGFAVFLRGSPPREGLAAAGWPLAASLGAAAALVGFRLHYFGFPFPNTYYAKMGGDRAYHALLGMRYDAEFVFAQPLLGLALALAVFGFVGDLPRVWRRLRGGAGLDERSVVVFLVRLVVFGGFALPLVEGGDHFWGNRMLQPFAPWLALSLAAGIAARLPAPRGGGFRIAGAAIAFACISLAWGHFVARNLWVVRHEIDQASHGRKLADLLEQALPPGARLPSVGVTAAGGFAYGYTGRAVDLMGLNWVAMAHSTGDRRGYTGHTAFSADVFWSEPPDLVSPNLLAREPTSGCGVYSAWDDSLVRGLLSSERFQLAYLPLSLPTREGAFVSYAHRSFLSEHPELAAHALAPESDCAAKRARMPAPERAAARHPKE